MTELQYDVLVGLASKMNHTISIDEPSKPFLTTIKYNPLEKQELIIIWDENYETSPLEYPDQYYCNTFEELKSIIEWLGKYEEAYPEDKSFFGFPKE